MKKCEQVKGLSIYQHGLDVANRYRDLYNYLDSCRAPIYKWCFDDEKMEETRQLLEIIQWPDGKLPQKENPIGALPPEDVRTYHIFHDCGKPSCLTINEEGKRQFPNHAEESAKIFRELFIENREFTEAAVIGKLLLTEDLIKKDMWAHTARGEEIDKFCRDPLAPTLLLTAWAEIHANAQMFGGFDSISFKIKRKHLEKTTKRLHRWLCATTPSTSSQIHSTGKSTSAVT